VEAKGAQEEEVEVMNEKQPTEIKVEAKFPLSLPVFRCRNCFLIWLPDELSADLRIFYEKYSKCPKCGHDKVRMRLTVIPQRVAEDLLHWPYD